MKILIADDERMICEWLEYCIADRQDFRSVGTAYNGEQALALFYETKPDIVAKKRNRTAKRNQKGFSFKSCNYPDGFCGI